VPKWCDNNHFEHENNATLSRQAYPNIDRRARAVIHLLMQLNQIEVFRTNLNGIVPQTKNQNLIVIADKSTGLDHVYV
jgi:hypothetical protein